MLDDPDIGVAAFESKEVLLKIIERPQGKSEEELIEFIESISDATNKQSKIVEADRRSNAPRLIDLQTYFYKNFGLFLERKRGEFQYGLDEKVILKTEIIDRVVLARSLTAFDGDPAKARSSQDRIFEEEGFDKLLNNIDNLSVAIVFFALGAIENEALMSSHSIKSHTIRYGKYAVLMAVSKLPFEGAVEAKQIKTEACKLVSNVASKWNAFEEFASSNNFNLKYKQDHGFDFDGYYKGSTVMTDISDFCWL
jgi:AIPR protein